MPLKKDPVAQLAAEESSSVSSPVRRSTRISLSAANSPAPSVVTRRRTSQTETTSTPKVAKSRRLSQVLDEKNENVEVKPTTRGRRASQETKQPPSPRKQNTRQGRAISKSPSLEPEKNPVRRGRKASTTSEESEGIEGSKSKATKSETIPKPVRGRRSSVTKSDEPEKGDLKATRSRRNSAAKEVEETKDETKKTVRGRRTSVEKADVPEQKITTRRRRSSVNDEVESKTANSTPIKGKRRSSVTENLVNLEDITENEELIPDSANTELVVNLTPIKKKKIESALINPNLSIISEQEDVLNESSITPEKLVKLPSPRRSPRLNSSTDVSEIKSPKPSPKRSLPFSDEDKNIENIAKKRPLQRLEGDGITNGSDGSFVFNLNVSIPDSDDNLNASKGSAGSDKENSFQKNTPSKLLVGTKNETPSKLLVGTKNETQFANMKNNSVTQISRVEIADEPMDVDNSFTESVINSSPLKTTEKTNCNDKTNDTLHEEQELRLLLNYSEETTVKHESEIKTEKSMSDDYDFDLSSDHESLNLKCIPTDITEMSGTDVTKSPVIGGKRCSLTNRRSLTTKKSTESEENNGQSQSLALEDLKSKEKLLQSPKKTSRLSSSPVLQESPTKKCLKESLSPNLKQNSFVDEDEIRQDRSKTNLGFKELALNVTVENCNANEFQSVKKTRLSKSPGKDSQPEEVDAFIIEIKEDDIIKKSGFVEGLSKHSNSPKKTVRSSMPLESASPRNRSQSKSENEESENKTKSPNKVSKPTEPQLEAIEKKESPKPNKTPTKRKSATTCLSTPPLISTECEVATEAKSDQQYSDVSADECVSPEKFISPSKSSIDEENDELALEEKTGEKESNSKKKSESSESYCDMSNLAVDDSDEEIEYNLSNKRCKSYSGYTNSRNSTDLAHTEEQLVNQIVTELNREKGCPKNIDSNINDNQKFDKDVDQADTSKDTEKMDGQQKRLSSRLSLNRNSSKSRDSLNKENTSLNNSNSNELIKETSDNDIHETKMNNCKTVNSPNKKTPNKLSDNSELHKSNVKSSLNEVDISKKDESAENITSEIEQGRAEKKLLQNSLDYTQTRKSNTRKSTSKSPDKNTDKINEDSSIKSTRETEESESKVLDIQHINVDAEKPNKRLSNSRKSINNEKNVSMNSKIDNESDPKDNTELVTSQTKIATKINTSHGSTEGETNDNHTVNKPKKHSKLLELEEFANSKVDEYLKRKSEESSTDEDYDPRNQVEEGYNFLDDMAEECNAEESDYDDSNDIPDDGESIGYSEDQSSDDYDTSDSFICDEDSVELLSGEEYDLDDADSSKEKKNKKSRIIQLSDNEDTEIIRIERKVSPKKKKEMQTKSRIISIQDSSDEELQDLRDEVGSSEKNKNSNLAKKRNDDSVTTDKINDKGGIFKGKRKHSHLMDMNLSSSSDTPSRRRASITIQENIRVDEIKDTALSERINLVVESFCSTVHKGEISMNLSLQYADDSPKENDIEEKADLVSSEEDETSNNYQGSKPSPAKRRSKNSNISNEISLKSPKNVESIPIDKTNQITASCDDLTELDQTHSKSLKRRLSKSLDNIHIAKSDNVEPLKKKVKQKNKGKKTLKLKTSSVEDLRVDTFNLLNQEILTDVKNRSKRMIKPSIPDINTSWSFEPTTAIKPSTSQVSSAEKLAGREFKKVHKKDFKNQMLYDSSRVKRIETKALMKKRGMY